MPVYAWSAQTIDRESRTYNLSGSFYIEERSERAATQKMLHDIHDRHNGVWVVVQAYDLELIDGE